MIGFNNVLSGSGDARKVEEYFSKVVNFYDALYRELAEYLKILEAAKEYRDSELWKHDSLYHINNINIEIRNLRACTNTDLERINEDTSAEVLKRYMKYCGQQIETVAKKRANFLKRPMN